MPPIAGWVRGVDFFVVGLLAIAWNGRARWSGWDSIMRLALFAVLLLSVPEVLVRWAGSHVPGSLWTAVLAVVPVMVVLIAARSREGFDAQRLLVPALAGLGGILLLIPVDLPHSPIGWLSFALLIFSAMLVAIASVGIYRRMQEFSTSQCIAVFCLSNALVLIGAGVIAGWRSGLSGISWAALLVTALETLLLATLLRAMEPVRLSSRVLIVPLLTIAEGVVLLRPDVTVRMMIGIVLLLSGAGGVLFYRQSEDDGALSLR